MIRTIFILFFFLLLMACGKKEESSEAIPSNVLNEELFAKVLTDFALAESAANMNIKNADVRQLDSIYAFDPLKENKVRQTQYDSTITFYAKHPDLYKKVYEKVLATLNEIQAKRNPSMKDSISK